MRFFEWDGAARVLTLCSVREQCYRWDSGTAVRSDKGAAVRSGSTERPMCWYTVVLFDEREMSLWDWAGSDVVRGDFACEILLGIRGVVPGLIGE